MVDSHNCKTYLERTEEARQIRIDLALVRMDFGRGIPLIGDFHVHDSGGVIIYTDSLAGEKRFFLANN